MKKHILPVNATQLERALYYAFEDMVYRHANPYPKLRSPQNTSLDNLEYLAQERMVANWDDSATEKEKRDTVRTVHTVNRIAGTRQARITALTPLGGVVQVKKWWENSGEPFHLDLVVNVDRPIDAELTQRIHSRIERAKSQRDTYTLSIGAIVSATEYVSAVSRSTQNTVITSFIE